MRPALVLVPMALVGAGAPALTVAVDPAGGAPRLVVNGQPVRGRMFFGGPAAAPLPLSAAGGWVEDTFVALADEPRTATMHFRFGASPGRIVLDDIQVTELVTGRVVVGPCDFEGGAESWRRDWTFWPTGAQNTVAAVGVAPGVGRDASAGLRIDLRAPATGMWPDWHLYHHARLVLVKGQRYRIRFWARAEPARDVRIGFYRPGTYFVNLGGPGDLFASQIRLAAGSGARFVSFPVALPWPAPGKPVDWGVVDAACEQVLGANPDALLLPRIGLDAPAWWLAAHPDEAMHWDGGEHRPHAVVCSPLYRREASERLAALVEHLEARFGERVAGYHPCGQNTGEWFYEDTWGPHLNGYAPADEAGFRRWTGDPQAKVPSPEARRARPAGFLRDPVAERAVLDFAAFQQAAMADWVCEMARTVKRACGGRKLTVFFYGYVFEFAAVGTGASVSGHYALRRALDCPQIDVLCSPISYWDRGLGESAPSMTAAESVALAGKLWLNEDDTRTHLTRERTFPGAKDGGDTLAQTQALVVRNVAQEATRNFATWWMDLGSSGWYNDPELWREMARFAAVDDALLAKPTPYRPPIAAVIDEESMVRLTAGSHVVARPAVYEARTPLGRCGAPYGQYLQDDVAAGKVDARLYVMLSAWCLDAGQRAKLRQALMGKARVWCWAPGWQDGARTSLAAMAELTGFTLAPTTAKALATPTEAGRRLGLTRPLGVDRAITPLFAATDVKPDETLATWPDGTAAIALRRLPDGLSVFVGAPGLTSELLRAVGKLAGVHFYTQTDANIYANGPFVAVHTCADGPLELDLGGAGPVTDALSGAVVGPAARVTLNLGKAQTRILRRVGIK